tara:strand:+ start:300 stop:644 length:345 start_codon:yes stop_codon:yes gene_type:complete
MRNEYTIKTIQKVKKRFSIFSIFKKNSSNEQVMPHFGHNVKENHKSVSVESYRQILNELGELQRDINILGEVAEMIPTSEYNEIRNFEKLDSGMKDIHNIILDIERILFTPKEK